MGSGASSEVKSVAASVNSGIDADQLSFVALLACAGAGCVFGIFITGVLSSYVLRANLTYVNDDTMTAAQY